MKLTHLSNDTEPRRALRTHRPGAVLTATDGGEHVSFSIPAGLSVWRMFVASYPWPAALLPGAMPAYGGYCVPAHPPVLRSLPVGGEERLDRPIRDTSTVVTHQFSSRTC